MTPADARHIATAALGDQGEPTDRWPGPGALVVFGVLGWGAVFGVVWLVASLGRLVGVWG